MSPTLLKNFPLLQKLPFGYLNLNLGSLWKSAREEAPFSFRKASEILMVGGMETTA